MRVLIFLSDSTAHYDARSHGYEGAQIRIIWAFRGRCKGIPTGILYRLDSLRGRIPVILQSTVITKLKRNRGFKCRLCIRGDHQPEAVTDFVSATTAAREYVRIAVVLFVNDPSYVFKTVDVSRAPKQSDYYHKQDRVWVELPKFVFPASNQWKGELFLDSSRTIVEDAEGRQVQRPPPGETLYAVQLFKPLYGTRDAPMRRYCRLAEIFISHSFAPLGDGRCVFSRFRALRKGGAGYTPNAVLTNTCIVVVHVDDIIFSGIRADWEDLRASMGELKHGEWEELSQGQDVTSVE